MPFIRDPPCTLCHPWSNQSDTENDAVNLQSLVDNLIADTLESSLPLFWPELIICATIVVLLLVRAVPHAATRSIRSGSRSSARSSRFVTRCPAGGSARRIGGVARQEIFTGMLVYDSLTVFFRMFLLAFAFWFIILVRMTGLADSEDGQDFYTLLLGRDARHVPDGVGQSPDDGLPGRRDGERAVVRAGRHPQGPPPRERSGAQVRRVRRGRRRRHALRHQPARRPVGHGPPADDRHQARRNGYPGDDRQRRGRRHAHGARAGRR